MRSQANLPGCQVEFIGGPLDGHVQGLSVTSDELSVMVAIPVSPGRLAALSGRPAYLSEPRQPPTTIALYELDTVPAVPPRCIFLGAVRPEDIWNSSNR